MQLLAVVTEGKWHMKHNAVAPSGDKCVNTASMLFSTLPIVLLTLPSSSLEPD